MDFDYLLCNVALLDSNGSAVVFSPEHVPENEILYVTFSVPILPVTVHLDQCVGETITIRDSYFNWDKQWNSTYCGYGLSEENRKLYSKKSPQMRSRSLPIAISNRSFDKGSGIFRWRIIFKEDMIGNRAGIISEDEISFPRKCATFGNYLPSVPWFYRTSENGKSKVLTFLLDMNKLELTVNGKTITDIPERVHAGVCFNTSVKMEALVTFDFNTI